MACARLAALGSFSTSTLVHSRFIELRSASERRQSRHQSAPYIVVFVGRASVVSLIPRIYFGAAERTRKFAFSVHFTGTGFLGHLRAVAPPIRINIDQDQHS